MDLKLINDDLVVTDFDFVLVNSVDETAQRLEVLLKTYLGELFYNTEIGTPYYEKIFDKDSSIGTIEAAFKSTIVSMDEVSRLLEFSLDFDDKRQLIVKFKALLATGEELIEEGLIL